MVGFFEFSVWFRHDFTGFLKGDCVADGGTDSRPKGREIEGCVRIAGNPGDGKGFLTCHLPDKLHIIFFESLR